jgi:hypothetical protein
LTNSELQVQQRARRYSPPRSRANTVRHLRALVRVCFWLGYGLSTLTAACIATVPVYQPTGAPMLAAAYPQPMAGMPGPVVVQYPQPASPAVATGSPMVLVLPTATAAASPPPVTYVLAPGAQPGTVQVHGYADPYRPYVVPQHPQSVPPAPDGYFGAAAYSTSPVAVHYMGVPPPPPGK